MYKAKKASFQAPRAKSGTDLSSSQGPSYQGCILLRYNNFSNT